MHIKSVGAKAFSHSNSKTVFILVMIDEVFECNIMAMHVADRALAYQLVCEVSFNITSYSF